MSSSHESSCSGGGSDNDANTKLESLLKQGLELAGIFKSMRTKTNHIVVKLSNYEANVDNSREIYLTGCKWLQKVINVDLLLYAYKWPIVVIIS
jgi:hypothetical protein